MSQLRKHSLSTTVYIVVVRYEVFVLLVHFFPTLQNLLEVWMKIGKAAALADNRQYLPIHDVWYDVIYPQQMTSQVRTSPHRLLSGAETQELAVSYM